MTELEIAHSQIVQLTTQCVLLRGEVVTLKEKLAAARRDPADVAAVNHEHDYRREEH